MKKRILLIVVLILPLLTISAQNVPISKSFLAGENWRVASGISLGVAPSGMINYIDGNIPEKYNEFGNSSSFALNLDVYSANSILGFYTALDFNKSRVILTNDYDKKDSIALNHIEIPLYLKFRFGSINGHGQTWLALGGGYAFPQVSTIKTFNSSDSKILENEDKDIAQSTPFASAMLGYEYMFGEKDDFEYKDNFRLLFYVKLNYDLSNRLNPDYPFDNNTVISEFNQPNMRFMKVSFGITFLMRFKALGRLFANSLNNQNAR